MIFVRLSMCKALVVIVGPFLITVFFMLDMFCDIERAAADADVAVYLAAALWRLTVTSQQLAHELGEETSHARRFLSGGSHQSESRTFLP